MPNAETAEHARLAEATGRAEDDLFTANPWYEWGPYLSERAWGTVREDYSESGDAWDSFPHDHARSRAYRWNEDGMAGISDIRHELCLALALWNGSDPILKERMFGLTGPQGNHGEDVKEYWWYLEGLPSHALLKWRYHYPQAEFPYEQLVNHGRGLHDPELELLDTGVFDDDRYWSVDVTYAKASPTEVLMRIELENHGPDEATLHVLPTLWFRNTWSWDAGTQRPRIERDGAALVVADHAARRLPARGRARARRHRARARSSARTRRTRRASSASQATTPYPKDGINDHVVSGAATVNPDGFGTKAALRYRVTVPGRRARPSCGCGCTGPPSDAAGADWAGAAFDEVVAAREADADEFYAALAPAGTDAERDADPAPGVRRARLEQADVPLRRRAAGSTATRASRRRPRRTATAATATGGTSTRSTCSRCRTRGSTRGSRPGTSASTAIPWAHLDPAFAKYQLARAAARVVPAPERRAAGLRVELRRRQPAGARDGRAPGVPHRRRRATASSSSGSSRSC